MSEMVNILKQEPQSFEARGFETCMNLLPVLKSISEIKLESLDHFNMVNSNKCLF